MPIVFAASFTTPPETFGSETNFSGGNTYHEMDVIALDSSRALWIYRDSTDQEFRARVLNISGQTITAPGGEAIINSGNGPYNNLNPRITALSSSVALISYYLEQSDPTNMQITALTISGNTVTVGSTITVGSIGVSNSWKVNTVSSTRGLFTYTNPSGGIGQFVDVSAGVPSLAGSANVLTSDTNQDNLFCHTVLDSSTIMFAKENTGSFRYQVEIATISGTTLTPQGITDDIDNGFITHNDAGWMVRLDANSAFLCWENSQSGTVERAAKITRSGNTPTVQTAYSNTIGNIVRNKATAFSASKVLWAHSFSTSSRTYIIDTTTNPVSVEDTDTTTLGSDSFGVAALDNNKAIQVRGDTAIGTARLINV